MLARWLKVALALEWSAFLALAIQLAGATVQAAIGWGIAGLAATCLVATLVTYAFKWIAGRDGGAFSGESLWRPIVLLGSIVREWLAFIALFVVLQPFERWWMGSDEPVAGDPEAEPVVLLVHGYFCNRGLWWWLRRSLLAERMRIATVNLESPFSGIEQFAGQLHRRIEAIAAQERGRDIVIVAHSMGGLVARCYMQRYGTRRIAKVVTIGTPHYGTSIARLGLGRCARQMQRGSAFLQGLPDMPDEVAGVSIWSAVDNFLVPSGSARIAGAREIEIDGIGHLSMAFSRRVRDAVVGAIREVRGQRRSRGGTATYGSPA